MMKKYVAPQVQTVNMDVSGCLLDGSKRSPIQQVTVKDSEGTDAGDIKVHPTDKGVPSGDIYYSKQFDSWDAWDD